MQRERTSQETRPRDANACVANAPIFVLFDTLMGHGTIGGYVSSFAGQGREAGKIASRILKR